MSSDQISLITIKIKMSRKRGSLLKAAKTASRSAIDAPTSYARLHESVFVESFYDTHLATGSDTGSAKRSATGASCYAGFATVCGTIPATD